MHATRSWTFLIVLASLSSISCSQTQKLSKVDSRPLQVEELGGGSIVTDLGYGIQLNKGSSLQRRWFVINDPSCSVQLKEAGINTVYRSTEIGGDYKYIPAGTVIIGEKTSAFEVRFLLFDIWGEHMRTLSDTEVSDLSGQIGLKDTGSWTAWENDVSELLTVVSFVSRVKRPDGTVWDYDSSSLLQQVEKIKVKLTEKELAPEKEKPKS